MCTKRIKGIRDIDLNTRKQLSNKILDNDFRVNMTHTAMYIRINKTVYKLSDEDVKELAILGIEKRLSIKKGMTVKEFYKETRTYTGYRLFEKELRPEFQEGELVEDKGTHGLYFTTEFSDMFRIMLASYREKFGEYLATISLISLDGKNKPVRKASISKGYDTKGTYHSRAFYVEKIQPLNNYELIMQMYEAAPDYYKRLVYDDSEDGFYMGSIAYYGNKGCNEIVRALNDIHQIEKKRRSW